MPSAAPFQRGLSGEGTDLRDLLEATPEENAESLTAADWPHPYPRDVGAALAQRLPGSVKYWPPVGRVDNVYGDRNLFCSCLPVEDFAA